MIPQQINQQVQD
jgi:cell division control protein 45